MEVIEIISKEYYCSEIPQLRFFDKDSCEEFKTALEEVMSSNDWISEWESVYPNGITAERGYYYVIIDQIEDEDANLSFSEDLTPNISRLLLLSENADRYLGDNEMIDMENTYYPVLNYLKYKYGPK